MESSSSIELQQPSSWKQRLPFMLAWLWILITLSMGAWWIYIAFHLGSVLEQLDAPHLFDENLFFMLKWEGIFFIVLLLLVASSVMYLFWKDREKHKSLRLFYSSLTHDLKTPLAVINLQSEILDEKINTDFPQAKAMATPYLSQLRNSVSELTDRLQNLFYLSQIHLFSGAAIEEFDLKDWLSDYTGKMSKLYQFELSTLYRHEFQNNQQSRLLVSLDKKILEIILGNLISNTINHGRVHSGQLEISKSPGILNISFSNHGHKFEGDFSSLGKKLYKSSSSKGSGIGLYLISKLCRLLKGQMTIELDKNQHLSFHIVFPQKEKHVGS